MPTWRLPTWEGDRGPLDPTGPPGGGGPPGHDALLNLPGPQSAWSSWTTRISWKTG